MISDTRIYQAYYTKSEPIVNYMINLLELSGKETIFEPCAGDGIFIDSVIEKFSTVNFEAFELNENSANKLSAKYSEFGNICIKQTDTLTDIDLESICALGGKYDAVIANPPYGAWRDNENRKLLKMKFNGLYAKESYSLFLYRCIESLRDGGKLVFIIPDTYLHLHMHKDIRRYILTKCKIKEIALFPSSYFPNVNFGYANLSIIALEKCSNVEICMDNVFSIIKGYKSVSELGNNDLENIEKVSLKQDNVLSNSDYAFITNGNQQIISCINESSFTIKDVCDCVTGFYSGNDKEFLKVLSKEIRNSKKYDTVNVDKVSYDCNESFLYGVDNEKNYVPIVKGGNTKYNKPDNWFMYWSKDAVMFYQKDKKARFQNSSFYFRKGIAVPMVSSSSITGALINNRLFDQSIVGIFPKQLVHLEYLLAFFNSPTCNSLIRTINPSTNNSSNYIKKIPFIKPNDSENEEVKLNIGMIIEQLKSTGDYDVNLELKNNQIIKNIYGF